jgi:hypothetical protein
VTHEYVHAVIHQLSNPGCRDGWNEGLATYLELGITLGSWRCAAPRRRPMARLSEAF